MGTMQEHEIRAKSKLRNQDDILRLCANAHVFLWDTRQFLSNQYYRGATPKHQ